MDKNVLQSVYFYSHFALLHYMSRTNTNFEIFIDLRKFSYLNSDIWVVTGCYPLLWTGQGENVLVGVVGASYSGVTQPLATATFALNLPLISYAASSEGRLHLFMGERV
jgi:hypothetical protein